MVASPAVRWHMTLVPGSTLNGKYRVIDRLGSGGMGTVWRGHDLDLDREVAIKVMRDASCDAESLERFRREAMLAARLDHPGITLVHDFDGHEGQFFIVMQMLTGRDLRATLECHPGGLPVPMAVDLAVQAAEALSAAHGHGVVHRDLKPANLFIVAGDKLKICGLRSGQGRRWHHNDHQAGSRHRDTRVHAARAVERRARRRAIRLVFSGVRPVRCWQAIRPSRRANHCQH